MSVLRVDLKLRSVYYTAGREEGDSKKVYRCCLEGMHGRW